MFGYNIDVCCFLQSVSYTVYTVYMIYAVFYIGDLQCIMLLVKWESYEGAIVSQFKSICEIIHLSLNHEDTPVRSI